MNWMNSRTDEVNKPWHRGIGAPGNHDC